MSRRATILDVAREAGVSKSTVSLVLRQSPLVKEETAVRVRAVMAQMGYVYNRAAAQMRGASVGLIGLVINDLRNPFFTEFATSLQMALSAKGYATVIGNADEDGAVQAQLVRSMIEHGVSAIVISPVYDDADATFQQIERAELPCLQVLRPVSLRGDLFPFSTFDYARGGALAAEHLLERGARRVAFVGGVEGRATLTERMNGYLSTLAAKGMKPLSYSGPATRAFGAEMAERLTRERPNVDAAVCFNDQVALGMLSGFARLQRAVGKDFFLVGFDDIEECSQVWPRLSSVNCDISGFGQRTADKILNWIENNERPEPLLREDVRLVARESSLGEGQT